jgi:hypothetical protein
MASRKGQPFAMTRELAQEAADALLQHGSNRAAAASLGIARTSYINRLDHAIKLGLTKPRAETNPSRWRPGAEIVAARKAEFERYKAPGDGRNATTIHMADDKPFCIVALGDPHLDSPGTDLELWERWINILDHTKHVHGWGGGDWLDNWVKPLQFLYATSETTAPEGWILLEHYLDQIGPHLIASVSGNHDDWSGHSDVLGMLMRKHGVVHRQKSLRCILRTPGGHEVSISSRHRWQGRSMWNEVHALKKAARMGMRDNILLGFDKHVSGDTIEKDPMYGGLTFCYQVAAFKVVDDYADDNGFLDRHVSPAVALVIDPRKPPTSPERVKHFYEPEPAVAYLKMVRKAA